MSQDIRMNQENAKKIGAFPHKDIIKHAKPGDFLVDVGSGRVILLKDKNAIDEMVKGYAWRGTYYKTISREDKDNYIICQRVYRTQLDIEQTEESLRRLEVLNKAQRADMQFIVMAGVKSLIVLFFNRDTDYDMSAKEVWLREGDKLVNFGRRYNNNNESLWVALVEVEGLLSKNVQALYTKGRWDKLESNGKSKASNTSKLSDTGFKSGDKFVEGCSLVKVNNGKVIKKPVDIDKD
jgi:hypothetical protein